MEETDFKVQFLNSVLGSIGGKGAQSLAPAAQPNRPQYTDTVQTDNHLKSGDPSTTDASSQNNKRKADDGLTGPMSKAVKSDILQGPSSRVASSANRPHVKPTITPKAAPSSPSKVAVPYRGTSKLNPASSAAVTASTGPATSAGEVAKAPKKGSYAEIMARAKATQAKPPAVGVISHKPKDISHKKQLKMKKKALKDTKLGVKGDSRPGSSGSLSSSPAPGSSKPVKSQPAYKGTAKSKPQPTYKGTMKSEGTAPRKPASRDRDVHASKHRYDEYAATDEDNLDDVEEDEYGSEESEDMEAGFLDVEQEESAAVIAARKEDEEEARLEARLKKEKEERRKRLEAMARKAKPQRY